MSSSRVSCIAAGGVVVCGENGLVLLIKRNGVWDLPKGKLESGETIPECAVREVEEETGLKGLSITTSLCKTYHEYNQKGKIVGKTTYWYLMEGEEIFRQSLSPQTEEGITNLKWEKLENSRKKVGYDNLLKVIDVLVGKSK